MEQNEIKILFIIYQIVTSLGLGLMLWTTLTYLIYKRAFPVRLSLYFCISSLFLTFFFFISSLNINWKKNLTFCFIQGLII
jgi:hypothetical protein